MSNVASENVFCGATFSAVPTFCRVAPRFYRQFHNAFVVRKHCAMWFHRNLGAPFGGLRVTPGWHLGLVLKGMFWQLCPDDVMRIPADRTHVDREIWRRTEKEKMDVATGRTRTSYELSCGAWHARERILNE